MSFGISILNFIWATIVNVLTAVLSCLLAIIVLDLIYVELFRGHITTCLPHYIMGVVTGVVIGFFIGGIGIFKPNVFFYAPDAKKAPHAFWVYIGFAINFLIYGGGAILSVCFLKDTFNSLIPQHDDWTILFSALGSCTGSSLPFMIITMFAYMDHICPKCNHMFCVESELRSSSESESVQFKTKTTNEKVGSVKVDDLETSVYTDVTRSYARKIKDWEGRYVCHCRHCDSDFNTTKADRTYGSWE